MSAHFAFLLVSCIIRKKKKPYSPVHRVSSLKSAGAAHTDGHWIKNIFISDKFQIILKSLNDKTIAFPNLLFSVILWIVNFYVHSNNGLLFTDSKTFGKIPLKLPNSDV